MAADLAAHVLQLARDLDVEVWIRHSPEDEHIGGEAQREPRAIFLTHDPGSSTEAYAVALHELGHHGTDIPWKSPRLDCEAGAWLWAAEHGIDWAAEHWDIARRSLKAYGQERRFKKTKLFRATLKRAGIEALSK